ncbi:MAG: hypothetical protein JNK82_19040 [Myxococcaceae bacterium]|nr:hypothetical protein [Myxococcaceae bacterium]
MSVGVLRVSVVVAVGLLALTGCGPKEVDIAVNVVTTGCDADADPFQGVNVLQVRVTGPGIEEPLVSKVARAEARIQIPKIPAGDARVIEVRGYADDASPRPLSIGRSIPTKIPDVIVGSNQRIDINIFLRKVDSFTRPVAYTTPRDCSVMRSQRAAHTATLLKDGRVFIAGGFRLESGVNRIALSTTEFFDPNTGTFDQGPVMTVGGGQVQFPKAFHTATLLINAQVLLYGGEFYDKDTFAPRPTTAALVFDVERNAYGALLPRNEPINIARTRHLAIAETSGRVLLVGGLQRSTLDPVTEVEWFDPSTNQVQVMMGESLPRLEASGATVQNGSIVVVAGGVDATQTPPALANQAHFYKYEGNAFVRAGAPLPMNEARRGAAAASLPDDQTVLVMGGYTDATTIAPTPSSEVIKTSNNTVATTMATIGERGDACAVTLPQGTLVIGGRKIGGFSDGNAVLVRVDAQGTSTSTAAAPLKVPRYFHTCTTLTDGSVLVIGGIDETSGSDPRSLNDAWIYTPIPVD